MLRFFRFDVIAFEVMDCHVEGLVAELDSPLNFWIADVHVSLLSRRKRFLLRRASEERAQLGPIRTRSSHVCLSAMVPAFAEPDIHSLSQILADRHRRAHMTFTRTA